MTLETIATKIKTAPDLWHLYQALLAFEKHLFIEDGDEAALWAYDHNEPLDHHNIDSASTLEHHGVDLCALPTFGGKEPRNTDGLWSYDEHNLLVGDGLFRDWELVSRGDDGQVWRA